jgi:predicted AAA+ superfamily ATPase
MIRLSEQFLKSWYNKPERKPLVIRGARQVGKSFIVRQLAKTLNVPLWEINLERHTKLNTVFATYNINNILLEIGIAIQMNGIGQGPGILFLDEIQATPQALASLRYFFEDRKDIAVISAGSLLEFALAEFKGSMPVGRIQYYKLGPLSFHEFLLASGNMALVEFYEKWQPGQAYQENAHELLNGLFREYLMIGGMPEAVRDFVQRRNIGAVREIHQSIIDTYSDDFSKYASGAMLEKLRRVYECIPRVVGEKLKPTQISQDWKAKDVRAAFDLLVRAGIATKVFHSHGTGVPLGLDVDDNVCKVLFLDCGLMQTALNMPPMTLEDFASGRFINEGTLAEQFIGQHLHNLHTDKSREALFYWLREGKYNNAEVDYLLQVDGKIIPIEVKAGKSGSMRSLHQFANQREVPIAVRFDLNTPGIQKVETEVMTSEGKKSVAYHLLSLPLYMVGRIEDLVVSAISLIHETQYDRGP